MLERFDNADGLNKQKNYGQSRETKTYDSRNHHENNRREDRRWKQSKKPEGYNFVNRGPRIQEGNHGSTSREKETRTYNQDSRNVRQGGRRYVREKAEVNIVETVNNDREQILNQDIREPEVSSVRRNESYENDSGQGND